MQAASERAFTRMPWTDHSSTDGVLYNPQGYELISHALANIGWEERAVVGDVGGVLGRRDREFCCIVLPRLAPEEAKEEGRGAFAVDALV